jgi:hypothetical protein
MTVVADGLTGFGVKILLDVDSVNVILLLLLTLLFVVVSGVSNVTTTDAVSIVVTIVLPVEH